MADDLGFEVEPVNLREILAALKEIEPKLATNLRREFRRSGDDILAAQRAALAKRPPKVGRATRRLALVRPRNRKPYFAMRTSYQAGDTRDGGVSQLRDKIAAGLRVRTSASARRQAIEFKTSGPRNGGANMARVFERRMFRHPVYGRPDQWVPQYGQPYFNKPINAEMRARMTARIDAAIGDALNAAATRRSPE